MLSVCNCLYLRCPCGYTRFYISYPLASDDTNQIVKGVPRRQPHRRSGLATLPSVGAIP